MGLQSSTRRGQTWRARHQRSGAVGRSSGSATGTVSSWRAHPAAEVVREQVDPYVERPVQSRDDGLWHEYQDTVRAGRTRQAEQRQALDRKVAAARASQRQQFKLRHHAIAAMPISAQEKRRHYKALSFERKAAERKLRAKIRHWRTMSVATQPGSWKQFLAAQAARGDRRAIRRLANRSPRGGDSEQQPADWALQPAARGQVEEASFTISRRGFDSESRLVRSSYSAMPARRRWTSS